MDLSMSEEFDDSLLDWEEDGHHQQPESDGMGSGSTSGSQTPLSEGAERRQQPLTTQALTESFSRLPSFPTSIGGYFASNEPQQSCTDAHGLGVAANLANPYAMQMLYPLTGQSIASTAAQVNASTGMQQQQQNLMMNASIGMQRQQQNLMVQYALTGQAAGAPFPTQVSFSNNKNQMDTVSCLSTTTGRNASSRAAMKQTPAPVNVPSKPAASTHVALANGTTQRVNEQPNQVNGALPTTQLHPLGIQSSAGCPPMSSTTPPVSSSTPNAMQFNPYMFNPYSMMVGNPHLFAAYQSSQQQLAAQYAAAQATAGQASVAQANAAQAASLSANFFNSPATTLPSPAPVAAKARSKNARAAPAKGRKTGSKKKDETPPFLLFDAPCELRQNFMATQRMLNLPVHQDGNSFHYGMTVNGFHPQINMATDPVPLSSCQLPPGVKLLDSRHKPRKGAGTERNEREQKRAQKITDLIEQIRTSMEDGGWKVEMKSKYHTLTMCADYVKHLIQSTEEKEEAVEKAKSDLEVKERKLEEDKALLEGRSDPESVTSSLTASSEGSGGNANAAFAAVAPSGNAKPVSDDTSSGGKRKAEKMEAVATKNDDSKKAKVEESSAEMSAANDGGKPSRPSGHNISIGKMSSSVSELTDSNRGSSDSGGEKAGWNCNAAHKKHPRAEEEQDESDRPCSSSISSTAAVLRGTGSQNRDHGHADVVMRERKHSRRKRFRSERSSLHRKFAIDYEEVFLTSNVPQIIATPAGRIVSWNKFFLRATCLDENSVQRLTIFSLVQQDKLANLFEMVAEALRQKPMASESTSGTSSSGQTTNESAPSSSETVDATEQLAKEYATMTLPCVSVLSAPATSDSSGETVKANPLYMTVTLMPDDDVHKRCFHCVFTDCPGTDGKMGFIRPELLAKLFLDPQTASEKLRARTSACLTKANVESKMDCEETKIEVNNSAAVDNGDGDCD